MQNFIGLDALQPEGQLDEPVDYDSLSDGLFPLLMVLDEEGQIALFAIFHDDDEHALLQEALVVLHDEDAIQLLQDFDLG